MAAMTNSTWCQKGIPPHRFALHLKKVVFLIPSVLYSVTLSISRQRQSELNKCCGRCGPSTLSVYRTAQRAGDSNYQQMTVAVLSAEQMAMQGIAYVQLCGSKQGLGGGGRSQVKEKHQKNKNKQKNVKALVMKQTSSWKRVRSRKCKWRMRAGSILDIANDLNVPAFGAQWVKPLLVVNIRYICKNTAAAVMVTQADELTKRERKTEGAHNLAITVWKKKWRNPPLLFLLILHVFALSSLGVGDVCRKQVDDKLFFFWSRWTHWHSVECMAGYIYFK